MRVLGACAMVALVALLGCKASPTDAVFACDKSSDCPKGWFCHADRYCYAHAQGKPSPSSNGNKPSDGGTDAGRDAGRDSGSLRMDAATDAAADAATDAAPAPSPCDTDNGGCDSHVECNASRGVVTCGSCPPGYDDPQGNGKSCTDIDECATDNGGCGGRVCGNNLGAPPTCGADIDECAGTNVCTVDFPCVNRAAGDYYDCRGLLPNWQGVGTLGPYTTTADTVLDTNTGLMWQRVVPATYAGCSGHASVTGDTCTWAEAKTYCVNLVLPGYTDWRLPSITELESLIEDDRVAPTIDIAAFPGTPAGGFWTFSPYVGAAGNAWGVSFNDGLSGNTVSATTNYVRCAR